MDDSFHLHTFCGKHLVDALFPVAHPHFHTIFIMYVLCQMLGRINRAVLAARTPEAEHQRREAPLDISRHMGVGQTLDTLKESENLAVVFKKAHHRLIEARQLLIRLVAAGIMG